MNPAIPKTELPPSTQLRKVVFGGAHPIVSHRIFALSLSLLCTLKTFLPDTIAAESNKNPPLGTARPLNWVQPESSGPPGTRYCKFYSETIKQNYSFVIYLPPGYEKDTKRRFPVLYFMHGGGGTPQGAARMSVEFDAASKAGKSPEMIIVFINGLSSHFANSRDHETPMEDVIIKDLIPYVDKTYRTINDRKGRWVEGFSMGGFGALHNGLKFCDLFGAVSALAPAPIGPDSSDRRIEAVYNGYVWRGDRAYWEPEAPLTLLKKNAAQLRGRTLIRLICGTADVKNTQEKLRELHELMESLKMDHSYSTPADVGHDRAKIYVTIQGVFN